MRGRESAEKRRKEVRRQERQKDKAARKKMRREQGPLDPDGEGMSAEAANDSDGVSSEESPSSITAAPAGAEGPRVALDVSTRSALDHKSLDHEAI